MSLLVTLGLQGVCKEFTDMSKDLPFTYGSLTVSHSSTLREYTKMRRNDGTRQAHGSGKLHRKEIKLEELTREKIQRKE